MLPTFVIGLREGLEAALIVGIVAAFLRQRGRSDLLRWVLAGVSAAVLLCIAVGVVLDVVSKALPQRQQEGLETVIGLIAVSMVTYMVVWMRRHARDLKRQLEGAAGSALAAGSGWALVVMAFLAVLREGFETVVFLLAAFNESGSGAAAAFGAVLGIVTAVGLGWAIYRGGVRLNLGKFFRLTGLVLVLVAGGLVVTALHTAHEAGWLNIGQQPTVDLSALVAPGSVQSSLLTGMLGVQAKPVLIEVIGWLVYLVPVGLFVAWPPGRSLSRATSLRLTVAGAALCLIAAGLLTALAPGAAPYGARTSARDGLSAQVVSRNASHPVVNTNQVLSPDPLEPLHPGALTELRLNRRGSEIHQGVMTTVYAYTQHLLFSGQPATLTYAEIAARNGGRLPLGAHQRGPKTAVPVSYAATLSLTVWLDPRTDRVIDLHWRQAVTLTATLNTGATTIGTPTTSRLDLAPAAAATAADQARHDATSRTSRRTALAFAVALGVLGGVALLGLLAFILIGRRRPDEQLATDAPHKSLIRG